jgi:hypothetical protein
VVAKVVWGFEIRQEPGNGLGCGGKGMGAWREIVDQYQTYKMFVSGRRGPVVQLKERIY